MKKLLIIIILVPFLFSKFPFPPHKPQQSLGKKMPWLDRYKPEQRKLLENKYGLKVNALLKENEDKKPPKLMPWQTPYNQRWRDKLGRT